MRRATNRLLSRRSRSHTRRHRPRLQHLVHKTVLTIIAWILFSILLWGRHQLGWRSQTAVRFTLAGFAMLMLAYFGSKMVLELVLQRP